MDLAVVTSYGRYFTAKNTIYCFESLHEILKYNLKSYYNIPDENFYSELSDVPGNAAVLHIFEECVDIPKEITDDILNEYKTTGNIKIYDKENKKIIAEVYKNDNAEFKNYTVDYACAKNFKELREKNTRAQEKIIEQLEENGVQFVSPDGVGISPLAEIGQGVVIYQGTIIRGNSKIGKNSILGPNTIIDHSIIGENCIINSTQIYSSTVESNVATGPFCHIRPNCVIKNGVHLGNFVEVKNSTVGENTKAGHLTYIGDSDVGRDVNFGCGSITVNYDGLKKARCKIGDRAFIGSNANLISVPDGIEIGDDAYIAGGSTITKNVPSGVLAISRAREQKIIDGWVAEHKNKK